MRLQLYVEHLTTAVGPVGRVYAVGAEECSVLAVSGELRQLKLHGTTALTAALLGLFAFWLSHRRIEIKCGGLEWKDAGGNRPEAEE